MRPPDSFQHHLFSADEIARAAGASRAEVRAILQAGRVVSFRQFVAPGDAVALVRQLSRGVTPAAVARAPLTVVPPTRTKSGVSLVLSGLVHGIGVLLLILATTLGLLSPHDTEEDITPEPPARIVYLLSAGPGGGGGGGGLRMPAPPPPAKRKAPAPPIRKVSSPVVPVRRPPPPARSTARLPQPIEPPRIDPKPIDTPPPPPPPPAPQVIQAPVAPAPADPVDSPGALASTSTVASAGPGRDGGVGSGAGTGTGSGSGAGLGPGTGGGTGGGPFRPGSGIEPPTLVREVRPIYTEEGRKRAVEGDVVLEIVVLRDGRVGNIRTLRTLGAGLDQKAIEAVRQWRFAPARRQGSPVDVVVEVSVEFKLR